MWKVKLKRDGPEEVIRQNGQEERVRMRIRDKEGEKERERMTAQLGILILCLTKSSLHDNEQF